MQFYLNLKNCRRGESVNATGTGEGEEKGASKTRVKAIKKGVETKTVTMKKILGL